MIEAVLLDVDGTLVDSNALHAEAWQRTFAHFGIDVSFEAALRQLGKGGDQLIPVFVPKEKLDELQKPLEEYRKELFKREYLNRVQPFPCVRELVEKLRDSGKKVTVASSAKGEELEHYEKITHIGDLIGKETTSEDAERTKPYPDIFAAALRKMKVPAERAVSVGDTPYDAEASGKIGIRTVGVESGGWSAEDLRKAGCVEVYRDVSELLARFEESILAR